MSIHPSLAFTWFSSSLVSGGHVSRLSSLAGISLGFSASWYEDQEENDLITFQLPVCWQEWSSWGIPPRRSSRLCPCQRSWTCPQCQSRRHVLAAATSSACPHDMIQPGEKLPSPEVCEAEELFLLFVLLSSVLDGVGLCTTHYLEISHVLSSHLSIQF